MLNYSVIKQLFPLPNAPSQINIIISNFVFQWGIRSNINFVANCFESERKIKLKLWRFFFMKINMIKMKVEHKTWYFRHFSPARLDSQFPLEPLTVLRNRSKLWAMIYNSYKYIIIWSVCNKDLLRPCQFVAIQRIVKPEAKSQSKVQAPNPQIPKSQFQSPNYNFFGLSLSSSSLVLNFLTCLFPSSFSICRLMWFSLHSGKDWGRVGTSRAISTQMLSDEVKMARRLRVARNKIFWISRI